MLNKLFSSHPVKVELRIIDTEEQFTVVNFSWTLVLFAITTKLCIEGKDLVT